MSPRPVPATAANLTASGQESAPSRRVAQLAEHLALAEGTKQDESHTALPTSYPVSKLQLSPTQYLDHVRRLRVAVIGAGLAGINAGILLPAKVPGIELTIFEKNSDVVSAHKSCGRIALTTCRVARGLRTCTPEYDATFHLMCIKRHTRPTRNGPKSSRKALRYVTIGRRRLRSTTSTSMSDFCTASTKRNGMTHTPNGG